MEAVERKKEREVKFTDRVPPPKRTRTGCTKFNCFLIPILTLLHSGNTTVPPKTLFQKTRSEASKIQKFIYNARVLPSMPTAKTYQVTPQMAEVSSSGSSSRTTVNTVIKRRPAPAPLTLPASRSVTSGTELAAHLGSRPATSPPQPSAINRPKPVSSPAAAILPSEPPRIAKSPPTKKDLMATLFVPKHKAYSQRPVSQLTSSSSFGHS